MVTKPIDIRTFFTNSNDSVESVISRMASKDGLTSQQIAKSIDIRKGLQTRKLKGKIPISVNGVVGKIKSFGRKVVAKYKVDIEAAAQNSKLSIVFDEWTSLASKRYINIILLSSTNFWNLGLVPIKGSATADNCLDLVKKRLKYFGLSLEKDIVCIVTDGCSVMSSIGTKIGDVRQQLCIAHAIQLAIVDVLYVPINTSSSDLEDEEEEDSDDDTDSEESENETDDKTEDDTNDNADDDTEDENQDENQEDEKTDDEEQDMSGEITVMKKKSCPIRSSYDLIIKKV